MTRWSVVAVVIVLGSSLALGQEPKEPPPVFAEPKKDWAWDEDKRFDFLMERLASLEASLDVVQQAIAKTTGKKGAKLGEARRAEAGNSMMDRKGGGPMKWNEFYGTTAEKFFYHPVDPNTTYHTNTVLRQMGGEQTRQAGAGVPADQGVPAHQRPPQFDYIYRANREAKARAEAEASELANELESLHQRRDKLEAEQADLWCRLAFRAIQRLNIPRRPLLRFHLVAKSSQSDDISRATALEAASRFLATALLIIEKADSDQATAFGNIKVIVTNARNEYDDALLDEAAVADDAADRTTPMGQFTALAQLLDDTASNLSESYEVAIDGNAFRDTARKEQFRGVLQRSLVEYAQVVMALDELTRTMQTEWGIKVDTKRKTPALQVNWERSSRARDDSASQHTADDNEFHIPGGLGDLANLPAMPPAASRNAAPPPGSTSRRTGVKATTTRSIQPVPEPKGLADEIRACLPTAEELEVLRNAVNLPESRVREAKYQHLKRIYASHGADKWTALDVAYLMAMNDALSAMSGVSSLPLPGGGTVSGGNVSHCLADGWVLKSRDVRQFIERVKLLDPKTRAQFDQMVMERQVREWLLAVDPPLTTTAAKARALDTIMQAGITGRGVTEARRTIQAALDANR